MYACGRLTLRRIRGSAMCAVLARHDSTKEQRVCGKVTKWMADLGYGFVTRPDGRTLFVHHSEVSFVPGSPKRLPFGATVEYVIAEDAKKRKPFAKSVTLVGGGPVDSRDRASLWAMTAEDLPPEQQGKLSRRSLLTEQSMSLEPSSDANDVDYFSLDELADPPQQRTDAQAISNPATIQK